MTAIMKEVDSQDADSPKEEKRIVSHSERAHIKNVINFEDLEFYCNGFGSTYNPPKLSITLAALTTKRVASIAIIDTLNNLKLKLAITIKEIEIAMIEINKLTKQLDNAIFHLAISSKIKEKVSFLCQKMLFVKITPLHPRLKEEKLSENELIENFIFSQIRFENRLDKLSKIIRLLSREKNYKPAEFNLTITALTAFLNNLKNESNLAIHTVVLTSDAINERDAILYNKETGLIKNAKDVKKYIKKLYGAKSIQFKLVHKLKFKNYTDWPIDVL